MSRAFVNEDQAAAQADQSVERRVSEQPNYVTASGLRQLQEELRAQRMPRCVGQTAAGGYLRYFTGGVPAATSRSKVQIGSRVRFVDAREQVGLVGRRMPGGVESGLAAAGGEQVIEVVEVFGED